MNAVKIAVESFNLAILPPMYLFAHLYYTDVLSITAVLGLILFNLKQRHTLAAAFGNTNGPALQQNQRSNFVNLLQVYSVC